MFYYWTAILRNKIIPDLQARPCLSRIVFMKDGAPPHITRCVKDVLKHHFIEERVINHQFHHVCYRDLKTSTQNYIHRVWQETWDQQIFNKLHNIHPSTSHWAALPVRRHDVRLTRLRIGHTRFTHRHLLLGENAPECSS
ncbi:RNA-directed DNA polymerase from mobile element jockey [Trichonephila clavipes]|nr:RNA-directed DNA polymerase from mobile element jockey [Trichonephila clavipes]